MQVLDPISKPDAQALIEALEQVAGKPLPADIANQTLAGIEALRADYVIARAIKDGPTKGQIRAALTAFAKSARGLQDALAKLDDASCAIVLSCAPEELRPALSGRKSMNPRERVNALLGNLNNLIGAAKKSLAIAKGTAGAGSRSFLDRLIDFTPDMFDADWTPLGLYLTELADLFFRTTGKEPKCYQDRDTNSFYKGNFLQFATVAAACVGEAGRDALGRTAQEATRRWRARRADSCDPE